MIESLITNKSKLLAILLDPDKLSDTHIEKVCKNAQMAGVDLFFVGGSLIANPTLDDKIIALKERSNLPVVLFPGSPLQITKAADAILFLSLISGRNADLLIGQQVTAAPYLRKLQIKTLPTGYILIDGGAPTTVSYISQTHPIPNNKPEIAGVTAMAGEMLGLQYMYLDAGSGAETPVSAATIAAVRKSVATPIIVGGGIRSIEGVQTAFENGANVVVIGNHIEENPDFILDLNNAKRHSEAIS